jgi:hypothetical protein
VALAVLAGCAGWILRDRTERQAKLAADLQAAVAEAQRSHQEGKWPEAQAAVKRAEALLQDGLAEPALAEQVQSLLRALAEEQADRRLVASLEEMRLFQADVNIKEDRFVVERVRPDYRQAFASYGVRPESMAPEETAALLLRRPTSVRATLLAALDHWLILARHEKAPEAEWLARVLTTADPDPWRQAVRATRASKNRQALEQLARAPPMLLLSRRRHCSYSTVPFSRKALGVRP